MRRILAVLAALATLGLVGSVGYIAAAETTASDTPPIEACVNKTSGALRIIAANKACSSNESRLVWNQQGVPGEDGQDAPTVFNAPNYTVTNTSTGELLGEFIARALCDPGDPVLHGRTVIKQDPNNPNGTVSQGGSTFNSGTQEGWMVDMFFPTGSVVTGERAFATAVCADLPPLRP